MLKISIVQKYNCSNWNKNFREAKKHIKDLAKNGNHLICFQEAYLSGYGKACLEKDLQLLEPYLAELRELSYALGVCVVLPSIITKNNKKYSVAYVWNTDKGDKLIYKYGLTPSEKIAKLYPKKSNRIFSVKGINVGLILCREIQDPVFKYIDKIKRPDFILWPSYWGWEYHSTWGPLRKDGKKDKAYTFVKQMKRPLIQINMAQTSVDKNGTIKKFGKSIAVSAKNKKITAAKYGLEDIVTLNYSNGVISKS